MELLLILFTGKLIFPGLTVNWEKLPMGSIRMFTGTVPWITMISSTCVINTLSTPPLILLSTRCGRIPAALTATAIKSTATAISIRMVFLSWSRQPLSGSTLMREARAKEPCSGARSAGLRATSSGSPQMGKNGLRSFHWKKTAKLLPSMHKSLMTRKNPTIQ